MRSARSAITAERTHEMGSLLELAGASGIVPMFGCRSGIRRTCITTMKRGVIA